MKKDDEIIESLDFNDEPSSDEMLDFDISDEMDLDIIEIDEEKDNKQSLNKLLNDEIKNKARVEIDLASEKLEEYKPSIKDLNIRNAKTKKIVKKSFLYIIIVMLLGFEFFINKTGEALTNLRVYASDNEPIKIVQNSKYGFIDGSGTKIVNPKYTYAEDFIYGYAIVKNGSNLPLIIDKGGKEKVSSGEYFSLYRAGTDIVASKVTNDGLKYAILDAKLNRKTKFIYDLISYKDGVYTFVKDNTVGLINLKGKEVYTYKLTDSDDKKIDVEPCKIKDKDPMYGVVKVNKSSFIINLEDGTVVRNATLNKVSADGNNVFFEIGNNKSKTYFYVLDNKIIFESDGYNSVSVPSINAGVIKAINSSFNYEYISTDTLEQLEKNISNDDVYYGDNVYIYKSHNSKNNKNYYNLVKEGKIYSQIEANFSIEKAFENEFAIIKYDDGRYGYLKSDGTILDEKHYEEANTFDKYGDAIIKLDGFYGIINKKGEFVLKNNFVEVKMASYDAKKSCLGNNKCIIYAAKKENKYQIYNIKAKKINNNHYDEIVFDSKYPIVKASTSSNDYIITSKSSFKITNYNTIYEPFSNYIKIKNDYYNYRGKLIYVDNSKKKEGINND